MAQDKVVITVQTQVNASIDTVWKCWITPADIIKWNSASDDWHTTKAENDFHVGRKFSYRMEAKDGSMGFDFGGVYDSITDHKQISYTMDDGRAATVTFSVIDDKQTEVIESFDAETLNLIDMQRDGWQAILERFRNYVEHQSSEK
ncbi:uncharacterized protein YndB with AHSA1/START domain [Dysgonomonas alginatilytica]|uniref:Uncharacterized protein YndB with AHSA1/START domain n=1 Tax=Dysgonomonas alginatilytica TaxID=1605892 RepID=A0A2V3PT87_9BACT|nr:SRPBCC domain-containing protein [Dysgonomonas alginatilytica]PXV66751.1 uncharacterized protein YndB with AHSA1/START domain [Dysgonomonas alginatilytica]